MGHVVRAKNDRRVSLKSFEQSLSFEKAEFTPELQIQSRAITREKASNLVKDMIISFARSLEDHAAFFKQVCSHVCTDDTTGLFVKM